MREQADIGIDKLVNKKQVAEMLSLSLRSVDRLIAGGFLQRIKVLGSARYRLREVLNIVNGGRHD